MNRVIKFRVWDEENKVMLYPGYGNCKEIYFDASPWNEKESGVLMQFTGLLDNTGKEIYEGDIVSYICKDNEHGQAQNLVAVVKWDNTFAAWGFGREETWNIFCDYGIHLVKVLGNIFENKELLK